MFRYNVLILQNNVLEYTLNKDFPNLNEAHKAGEKELENILEYYNNIEKEIVGESKIFSYKIIINPLYSS